MNAVRECAATRAESRSVGDRPQSVRRSQHTVSNGSGLNSQPRRALAHLLDRRVDELIEGIQLLAHQTFVVEVSLDHLQCGPLLALASPNTAPGQHVTMRFGSTLATSPSGRAHSLRSPEARGVVRRRWEVEVGNRCGAAGSAKGLPARCPLGRSPHRRPGRHLQGQCPEGERETTVAAPGRVDCAPPRASSAPATRHEPLRRWCSPSPSPSSWKSSSSIIVRNAHGVCVSVGASCVFVNDSDELKPGQPKNPSPSRCCSNSRFLPLSRPVLS